MDLQLGQSQATFIPAKKGYQGLANILNREVEVPVTLAASMQIGSQEKFEVKYEGTSRTLSNRITQANSGGGGFLQYAYGFLFGGGQRRIADTEELKPSPQISVVEEELVRPETNRERRTREWGEGKLDGEPFPTTNSFMGSVQGVIQKTSDALDRLLEAVDE